MQDTTGFRDIPNKADWCAVEGTPDVTQPTSDAWTSGEIWNLAIAWVCSIQLWVLLFVMVPVCESQGVIPECELYWEEDYYGDDTGRAGRKLGIWVWMFWAYTVLVFMCRKSTVAESLATVLPGRPDALILRYQASRPKLYWKIVCSHMERQGGKKPRYVQRTTHSATQDYEYDRWWDVSEPMTVSHEGAAAVRIHFQKSWKAADAHTMNVHKTHFGAWIAEHDKDQQKEVTNTVDIPGSWTSRALMFKDGKKPLLLGSGWYALFSFLTFGVLYQLSFYARTATGNFVLTKLIQRRPRPGDPKT